MIKEISAKLSVLASNWLNTQLLSSNIHISQPGGSYTLVMTANDSLFSVEADRK